MNVTVLFSNYSNFKHFDSRLLTFVYNRQLGFFTRFEKMFKSFHSILPYGVLSEEICHFYWYLIKGFFIPNVF